MKLRLERTELSDSYTAGRLYVDGVHYCDTLELPLTFNGAENVKDRTCIPAGTYAVDLVVPSSADKRKMSSAEFGLRLPMLTEVPNRSGILIHTGNTTADTLGCILVGESTGNGQLRGGSSRPALNRLMRSLVQADSIGIEITDSRTIKGTLSSVFTYGGTIRPYLFAVGAAAVIAVIGLIVYKPFKS